MTRRALLVGIDEYSFGSLTGCANDAVAVRDLLARNDDGSPNFECRLVTCPSEAVTRSMLKERIDGLFGDPADLALLYFSGHGVETDLGGTLSPPTPIATTRACRWPTS